MRPLLAAVDINYDRARISPIFGQNISDAQEINFTGIPAHGVFDRIHPAGKHEPESGR